MNTAILSSPAGRTSVVIVGAGQAGLSCSYCLAAAGIDHILLERGEVASSWRYERWDSLRLLTPNWQSRLPGWAYSGEDPDGFMSMPQVIDFLTEYARHQGAPIHDHCTVTSVVPLERGYRVETDRGDWLCSAVIAASGAFRVPRVPAIADAMPVAVQQLTTHRYRSPQELEAGGVLVVGAAASGLQIADEIRRSGREVTLAVGEHVRMPRSYRGRDIQFWMDVLGLLDEDYRSVDDVRRVRGLPSAQLIGTPERRDLDINALRDAGVDVVGRLAACRDGRLQFSGSLPNVARLADLKLSRLLGNIDQWIDGTGFDTGGIGSSRPTPTSIDDPPTLELCLKQSGIRTVLWATGYQPDYSWLQLPLLGPGGRLQHDGGVAALPGLYFMGLPFMRRRKSSFICGTGDDARDICDHLINYLSGEGNRRSNTSGKSFVPLESSMVQCLK